MSLGAKFWRAVAMSMSALLLMSSCSDGANGALVEADSREGYAVGRAAWLANGDIYFMRSAPGDSDAPLHLYRKKTDVADAEKVDINPIAACEIPYLSDLRTLENDVLGAVMECPNQGYPASLVSIEPDVGKLTPITQLYGGVDAAWSIEARRGWISYRQGGCSSIAPADGDSLEMIPALEPKELLPWEIDGDFHSSNCLKRGMIGFPVFAKAVDRILVLASPEAKDVSSAQLEKGRSGLPWHVFEIDSSSRRVRALGGDFVNPEGIAVAGDDIVVSASLRGSDGVFLVNVEDGSVTVVKDGKFGAPATSPDGRSIVLTSFPDRGPPDLVVLPIP